jgi:hypothetical protein
MSRRPNPSPTCTNQVLSDAGQWVTCGAPADGLYPDAAPFCPRCREAASAVADGIVAWLDEELAAAEAAEKAEREAA